MNVSAESVTTREKAKVAVANRIRKVINLGINGFFFSDRNYFPKFIFIPAMFPFYGLDLSQIIPQANLETVVVQSPGALTL